MVMVAVTVVVVSGAVKTSANCLGQDEATMTQTRWSWSQQGGVRWSLGTGDLNREHEVDICAFFGEKKDKLMKVVMTVVRTVVNSVEVG